MGNLFNYNFLPAGHDISVLFLVLLWVRYIYHKMAIGKTKITIPYTSDWSFYSNLIQIFHLIFHTVDAQRFEFGGTFIWQANRQTEQGRIQDLIGGGPDHDTPKLPTVHSNVVQVKRALFSVGSGACLRAPEALGYFITKYAFSPFWGTFFILFLK